MKPLLIALLLTGCARKYQVQAPLAATITTYRLDLSKAEKETLITLLKSSAYGADETRKRIYNRILEELEKKL